VGHRLLCGPACNPQHGSGPQLSGCPQRSGSSVCMPQPDGSSAARALDRLTAASRPRRKLAVGARSRMILVGQLAYDTLLLDECNIMDYRCSPTALRFPLASP
jgi:hypothetical protein